jgi:hypothetical protein
MSMPANAVETWGPIMWKMMHVAATKIGQRSPLDDDITSKRIKYIVDNLPQVIPCPDCQNHARDYIQANPFNPVGRLRGDLTLYVSTYLFEFHNAVRRSKGQPILVETVAAYQDLYQNQSITALDDQTLATYFRLATKYQIITADAYVRWVDRLRSLRTLLSLS